MSIIRIALVDDHDLVRTTLSKTLGGNSGQFVIVLQCRNGMELMDKLVQLPMDKRPHVILTDLNMPLMDGFETTVSVKKTFPEISVIVLSTRDDAKTVARLTDAGASGFLAKFVTDADDIFEAIKVVAGGGIYFKVSKE